jgi:hypothetical protein
MSRVQPAAVYALSMNAASASVSIRRSDAYGVSVTSEREITRRSTTVYALERRMPCRSSVSSEKMRCEVVVPMSMPTVRSRRRSDATLPASSCSSSPRPASA